VGAFFEQSAWANERLIGVCERLTDEQLDQHGTASYGSIRGTLLHLLSSEQSYLARAGGAMPADRVFLGQFPGFEVLKRAARDTGAALAATAESLASDAVVRGSAEDGYSEAQAKVLFVQAIHHSAEHRTQIVAMLSALGALPPEFDEEISGWAWGEETGALTPFDG
jgi:uncharacterized damage-inducible protein DinB